MPIIFKSFEVYKPDKKDCEISSLTAQLIPTQQTYIHWTNHRISDPQLFSRNPNKQTLRSDEQKAEMFTKIDKEVVGRTKPMEE